RLRRGRAVADLGTGSGPSHGGLRALHGGGGAGRGHRRDQEDARPVNGRAPATGARPTRRPSERPRQALTRVMSCSAPAWMNGSGRPPTGRSSRIVASTCAAPGLSFSEVTRPVFFQSCLVPSHTAREPPTPW